MTTDEAIRLGASAYFDKGRCSGHHQFNGRYCRDVAGPERWCIHCAGFMLLSALQPRSEGTTQNDCTCGSDRRDSARFRLPHLQWCACARSEGTTPAPATLDEDYAYEHARRLCDELRPIIEGDDLTRAVIRRYLTSAIVHGMKLHAEAVGSPGAVPEARPHEIALALADRWSDPEFWKEQGCRMDSQDCAVALRFAFQLAEARSPVPAPQDTHDEEKHDV